MILPIRISVEDFSNLYNVVELCSVSPDTLDGENTPVPESWTISEHKGSWVPGCSAGGSRKNNRMFSTSTNKTCISLHVWVKGSHSFSTLLFMCSETFWKNPQFKLVLREQDQTEEDEDEDENDDDDEDAVEGTTDNKKEVEKPKHKGKHCTVLVELLQKNRRQKDKLNFLYIAFHIYRVRRHLVQWMFCISTPLFYFWIDSHVSLCFLFLQIPSEVSIYCNELDIHVYSQTCLYQIGGNIL